MKDKPNDEIDDKDLGDVYDKSSDVIVDDPNNKDENSDQNDEGDDKKSTTVKDKGDKTSGGDDDDNDDDSKDKDDPTERLTSALEQVIARTQNKAGEQRRQLSPEEIKKLLNPVEVSAEMLKSFGIAEPTEDQIKGYQAYTAAMVKHFNSIMQLREENLMRKISDYATPMEQFYQEQYARSQRDAFYKDYPKLQKFDKFVKFAASQVKPTDTQGREKTVKQVMKEVAKITNDLLAEAGVNLDANNDDDNDNDDSSTNLGAPEQRNSTGVPRMASLSTGGRSGGNQNKGGGANNPDADIYK